MIVREDNIAAFILSSVLKVRLAPPFYGFVMHGKDGFPYGAFAFTNYSGPNVELSICCNRRPTVSDIRGIARLAFGQMRARRITVHTKASNVRAQAACKALGMRFECVAKDYYEDDDAHCYALLASEQKLIRTNPNEQFSA